MDGMREWVSDSAYVVVVMHGTRHTTRSTWPTAAEAERYMEKVRQQGVPAANIRLYRTRLVKPPYPDLGIAR